MIVFPAIDLKAGQVVRLAEGDMDRATVYGDDPAAQARIFAAAGAQHLHVVDLDGSFAGSAQNREAVEAILKAFPGHVQLGGGIRDAKAVDGWFDLGVSRVVMGGLKMRGWPACCLPILAAMACLRAAMWKPRLIWRARPNCR